MGRWLQGRDTGAENLVAHRLFLVEGVRSDALRAHDHGRWVEITQDAATEVVLRLSPGRLGAVGGGEASVRTLLYCGVDGGEFFTQGADTDLPDDQRADDGMSVCFETVILDKPLDTIWRPVLRVPVTLDATAYRALPGLRLTVSTAYYPMILPPPTDVTATLRLETAAMHFPSAPCREVVLPGAGPDTRPAMSVTPPSAERQVMRDRASGVTEVVIESDSGRAEHPEHGMVWRDWRRSDYTITRSDLLSYRAVEVCTSERVPDGVVTRVTATGRLRAMASDWVLEARIEATQDGEIVFERDWADTVARDHM